MKIKFNPLVHSASGAMGDMVFYNLAGQPVARKKGERTKKDPSAAQLAHQDRVKQAAIWSRATMADPKQRAEYAAACRGHQTPYNLGFRDFMTPPVIESMDLKGYTGKVGDRLRIKAWDDFEVKTVSVTIRDAENNMIEEGLAERGPEDWEYVAKTEVAPGKSVSVEVKAIDRPGNLAQARQWQFLPMS